MNTFVKCKICDAEVANEKCLFAIHKKVIGGKEYFFCSEKHAIEFERNMENE